MKIMTKEGVTVQVRPNIGKKNYRVEILIPNEHIRKEIKISQKHYFDLLFRLKKECEGDIVISAIRPYEMNCDLIDTSKSPTIKVETRCYYLEIKLKRKMYISAKVKKYNERVKKKRKGYSSIGNSSNPKIITSSKYVNYKGNNASKPFSGGSVTPK